MTLAADGKLANLFSLSLNRWSATRNWIQQRLLSSRYGQSDASLPLLFLRNPEFAAEWSRAWWRHSWRSETIEAMI